MWVNKMKIGRIVHCAAACIPSRRAAFAATVALFAALGAQAGTTYWLDNSVAASGDGTSRATAFKTWNEAWAALVATASGTSGHILNVVASETPYAVTSAPSALAGFRRVAAVRGVDGDGNDVSDPASVVVDGQGLYQIAPCNTAVDMMVSGITFRNASSAAGAIGAVSAGAAIDLKEFKNATQTGGNVVSNCVFESCTGGAALAVTGSSNAIVRCIFRSNTSKFASSLDIRMGNYRKVLPSYVRDCTFEGNDGSAATSEFGGGNAVFAFGLLEMSDCTFRANKGSMNGSAMYLYNGAAQAISDCSFLCNTNTYSGSEGYGGVVVSDYGDGDDPVFRSCTFSGNVCEDGYGCIRRGGSGRHPVSLYGCTFSDNRAKYGAAIALAGGNRTLLASNCVFRANSDTTATAGGVIYRGTNANVATYRVDLVDCEFSGNGGNSIFVHFDDPTVSCTNSLSRCRFVSNLTASHVINVPYGILLAEDCTFTNNVMADGTVLRCGMSNPGVGTTNRIVNCLFAKNTNSGESSTAPTALLMLYGIAENCTIADNRISSTSSGKKGSVLGLAYPTTTFLNCIFYGNDNDSSKWHSYTAARNCFVDFSNKDLDLSNIGKSASADPGFSDSANGDYTLKKGSVCRNAGANQLWMADAADLAGKTRINEDVVDVGCYEWFASNDGLVIFVR